MGLSGQRGRRLVAQNNPILVYFSSRTYFISYPPAIADGDSFQVIEESGRGRKPRIHARHIILRDIGKTLLMRKPT